MALWVVILAAGNGNRLRQFTIEEHGSYVPKQFYRLLGPWTPIEAAWERAEAIASPDRCVTVVAARHESWWGPLLTPARERHLVIQRHNRGTAVGIRLALAYLEAWDPEGTVLFLPADHYVANEPPLIRTIHRTLGTPGHTDHLLLYGITPDHDAEGYGWILPQRLQELSPVADFVEKPPLIVATQLRRLGALWNSFIMAGRIPVWIDLFRAHLPVVEQHFADLPGLIAGQWPVGALELLYGAVPTYDLSKDLLEHAVPSLRVVPVPPCGWTDLGTPERVLECRRDLFQHLPPHSNEGPPIREILRTARPVE